MAISLDFPEGRELLGLQWDTVYPARLLDAQDPKAEVTRDMESLGKTISCADRKPFAYTCLVVGGQRPIPKGVVAVLRFRIREEANGARRPVRILNVIGVKKAAIPVDLEGADTSVTIVRSR